MSNETTIKIKASEDGKNYTLEIVEEEARKGTRLDQRTAQAILAMDQRLREPEMMQMMQNFGNAPMMGAPMPQMRRMVMPYGDGWSPHGMQEMYR